MTARSRLLGGVNSQPGSGDSPPAMENIDSDVVVIITALLCALICVLGLVAVARCSWIRRITGGGGDSSTSPPPPASNIRGVKMKVLKSLPKLTYSGDDVEAAKLHDCAICLADFVAGDEIRVLPQCGHGFHVACVDTWLASHASCPSCRRILEVARCQECGRLPPATACSAAGLQPEARESQAR